VLYSYSKKCTSRPVLINREIVYGFMYYSLLNLSKRDYLWQRSALRKHGKYLRKYMYIKSKEYLLNKYRIYEFLNFLKENETDNLMALRFIK